MSENHSSSKKTKSTVAIETETETSPCADEKSPLSFVRHARRGAADLVVQHLHGFAVSLTTFLEEREKAIADDKGNHSTLKQLNKAHRKYREHTHTATNEFVDHLLEYKTATK